MDSVLESKVAALEAIVCNQQMVIEKIVKAITVTPQEIKRDRRNGKRMELVKNSST